MSAASVSWMAGVAGDPASPVHRLDPRAKLLGLLGVTVVAVSAPLGAWPVWAACALVLLVVGGLARVPAGEVWRRARVVLPLVVFVAAFVPFVRPGGATWSLGPLTVSEAGLAMLAAVAAKATIGTVSAVLLNATTPFPAVLRALEALRVPRLLVLIAAFTYRYLFVVVAEVGRLRAGWCRAATPRATRCTAAAVGRAASVLFLRTHARRARAPGDAGARLQRVDAARRGAARRRADVAFLALLALALLPARVVAEVVWSELHGGRPRAELPLPRRALALDAVDLHVGHGERVAILGPNGAGKTTLMLHLNGLLRGEGGLEVAGLEVAPRTLRALRARVGLVFQDPDDQLFMPTVARGRRLRAAQPRAGPRGRPRARSRRAPRRRDGRQRPERAPHTLSLGQRRRVAIATVLAMEPALLVLDEPRPTSTRGHAATWSACSRRLPGTMLLVTHDLPLAAQLCDRAVVLDVGRIVADGPCGAVLADAGLLAAHGLELPVGFDLALVPATSSPRRWPPHDPRPRDPELRRRRPALGDRALRARGLRVSAARRLLLAALFAADRPVSADELASGLSGRLPDSDLASIYRNLETLEELGVVRHVHIGHGPGLYAPAGRTDAGVRPVQPLPRLPRHGARRG